MTLMTLSERVGAFSDLDDLVGAFSDLQDLVGQDLEGERLNK